MNIRNIIVSILLLCGFHISPANSLPEDSLIVISGIVKEKAHKKPLAGTSLSVPGSNIATVTNGDGFFSIKIPREMLGAGIKAEYIGYASTVFESKMPDPGNEIMTVWLDPLPEMLDEITVYGAKPRELVEQAINKIPQNYPSSQNLFSSFYRETIQKGKRYIGISEAIVDVFKRPYKSRNIGGDRVQIVKGRRLLSQRNNDTIAVKIVGGPTLPVVLDVVKNENALFSLPELDYYEFRMEPMTSIDERRQFVVSFKPKVKVDYALYKGKVYIDLENHSFTRAEFSLDVSDKEKATRVMLFKKPHGLRFKPQEMEFIVTYKYQAGVSYLNYIRTKIRFKCDWKRRLFSSGYTAYAEMVMVDRNDEPQHDIPRKEAFRQKDIFSDLVDNFNDGDFWKDYNIIEPTESLEKAVLKLRNR